LRDLSGECEEKSVYVVMEGYINCSWLEIECVDKKCDLMSSEKILLVFDDRDVECGECLFDGNIQY